MYILQVLVLSNYESKSLSPIPHKVPRDVMRPQVPPFSTSWLQVTAFYVAAASEFCSYNRRFSADTMVHEEAGENIRHYDTHTR